MNATEDDTQNEAKHNKPRMIASIMFVGAPPHQYTPTKCSVHTHKADLGSLVQSPVSEVGVFIWVHADPLLRVSAVCIRPQCYDIGHAWIIVNQSALSNFA